MKDSTKIKDATYPDDISGLKLSSEKAYTINELYFFEAKNISKATLKYLSSKEQSHQATFSYDWFLKLHEEMFGEVWDWAGKIRTVELSIGIKAYLISMEIKKLVDDVEFWNEHKTFDIFEIASRIHHRAVQIHPSF